MADFIEVRGSYLDDAEPFFIFRDRTPVTTDHARKLLRKMLCSFGLEAEAELYDMHSLRIGRASDLIKQNYSIEQVKRMGHWKSNAVYKYIRQ